MSKTIQLTESELHEFVANAVNRVLEEGFLKDKLQDRRSTKANSDMKYRKLEQLLASAGVYREQLTKKTIHGDDGFLFTVPMDQAVRIAKELKPEGVRMFTVRQKMDAGDGEIQSAQVFACFGPYLSI